jgi:hypothetical protein
MRTARRSGSAVRSARTAAGSSRPSSRPTSNGAWRSTPRPSRCCVIIAPGQAWSRRSGSNRRPTAYKAVALPLSYTGRLTHAAGPRTADQTIFRNRTPLTAPRTPGRPASGPGYMVTCAGAADSIGSGQGRCRPVAGLPHRVPTVSWVGDQGTYGPLFIIDQPDCDGNAERSVTVMSIVSTSSWAIGR